MSLLSTKRSVSRRFPHAVATIAIAVSSGCSVWQPFSDKPSLTQPAGAVLPVEPFSPRDLNMFEGSTGRTLTWADVMQAASAADVTFIGERHDDPVGHQVQLAVYEEILAGYRGSAISLEHLERNEQKIVEQFLAGALEQEEFIDSTKSRNWAGKDSWIPFFQPMIEAARTGGGVVVAANAPRSYVSRAGKEGYEGLRSLPPDELMLFDTPLAIDAGPYRDRFRNIMLQEGESIEDAEVIARIDQRFHGQQVWDETMGQSVARALAAGAPKVVHCAGCFHIEYEGGTVLALRRAAPKAKVLTITVIDDASDKLRDTERDAAHIVIYGFPVTRKEDDATAS